MGKIKAELEDLLWSSKYSLVKEQIIDQGRWDTYVERVVRCKDSGKYYKFSYCRPSTENSGDTSDMNDPELELVEVHQVEKLVKVWEPVNASSP